jgi:hypothetical protein
MFQIRQSESTAARRRIPVLFVSSTDGFTPVTPTSPAAYISTNGATWVATTNAVAVATLAAGQAAAGVYYLELTAAEVANLGWITVNIQASNARQYNAHIQVMAFDPYDVVRIGLTSLPTVAQGNAGALLTSGTGVAQLNVSSGNVAGSVASVVGNVGGSVASVTGNVGGSVASVTGSVASVTGNVGGSVASVTGNVGGNVVGSIGSLTATAVQNIWDDATSSLTTVGSVGKLIVDNLNATVASRATDTGVWAVGTRTLTAGTNIVLAKGTGITGFNDISATDVWAAGTRTLSAGTNIVLAKGVGITGFNDITASNVWSETLPGSYTSTQAGFKLNAAGSAADPWSTTLPGAYSAGTAGFIIGNNLNSAVGSVPTNVWAAGTRTLTAGTNIVLAKGTGITGFNDITALSVWDVLASTVSVTGSIGLQLKTNVDAAISTRLSAAGYTAPLTTTGTAQAVWNALTSAYITNGSFGERVLRSTSTQSAVAVTGSNHVAADVHELQPAVITAADFAANAIDANALAASAVTEIQTGLATASAVATINTTTTKLDSTLQASGAVYQFTANALQLAPSGGGGGGSSVSIANGPYNVVADSLGANDALDIQQSTSQSISLRCVDSAGAGVSLSGATLAVKVYNTAGTLVTTYTGIATYAPDGWLSFDLTTTVTNTVGTYTITVTRTTGATDVTIYGPLRVYVRGI